jgi:hypothetical protein
MNLQDYSPQITQLVGAQVLNSTKGGAYYADTTSRTGTWAAIQMVTETKLETLTGNVSGLAAALLGSAPLLPAGLVVFGNFTELKLHSGSVIAYLR